MNNAALVRDFIDQIWNNRAFENLDSYLHSDFNDYSLPPLFSPDKEGLKKWITDTSSSFEHNTIIDDQVTEGDKSIIKIRIYLRHIGFWRNLAPTAIQLSTVGYRLFKIDQGKIREHWALIDGQAIEKQLTEAVHGCKVAE